MSPLPRRKTARLRGFAYSDPGSYFVTICCAGRRHLFESPDVRDVAASCWAELPAHIPDLEVDEFVVVPNHVHGIVTLLAPPIGRARRASPLPADQAARSASLSTIAGSYKSCVTRRIRELLPRVREVWQRNYYEHVVRDEQDLNRIREYIRENPLRWSEDPYFTQR